MLIWYVNWSLFLLDISSLNQYAAISRKVVGKTVHATIPKGNMGYNQYTCSWHCSCRTYFCCFPLALANIRPWNFLPFFEISLKNSELKTTHNTFRDCRMPGRTVGGRGTETREERAGSGISTMAGSGRELQKGKLSLFVTAYIQSKKRTQQRSLTSI